MKIFKNSNGKIYEIIDMGKDYSLLKDTSKKSYHPYIVAYAINKDSWAQGYYHKTLEEAQDTLNEKRNR